MIDHNPNEQRPTPCPVVITHQSGQRFTARIGRHDLILDQPVRGGGHDAGPSPIELLGAALGSCIGLYVHRFLAARGVADQGLQIEVTQHAAQSPHRVAWFDVRIIVPSGVPSQYRSMIDAVARVCPAYNTLIRGTDIAIEVVTSSISAGDTALSRQKMFHAAS